MRGELGSLYLSLAISSVIFCLPVTSQYAAFWIQERELTVAARLDRGFDVTNALDGDTVLVVTVDKQVL